jgi:hypothetical protein
VLPRLRPAGAELCTRNAGVQVFELVFPAVEDLARADEDAHADEGHAELLDVITRAALSTRGAEKQIQ